MRKRIVIDLDSSDAEKLIPVLLASPWEFRVLNHTASPIALNTAAKAPEKSLPTQEPEPPAINPEPEIRQTWPGPEPTFFLRPSARGHGEMTSTQLLWSLVKDKKRFRLAQFQETYAEKGFGPTVLSYVAGSLTKQGFLRRVRNGTFEVIRPSVPGSTEAVSATEARPEPVEPLSPVTATLGPPDEKTAAKAEFYRALNPPISTSQIMWLEVKDRDAFNLNELKPLAKVLGYNPLSMYAAADQLQKEGFIKRVTSSECHVLKKGETRTPSLKGTAHPPGSWNPPKGGRPGKRKGWTGPTTKPVDASQYKGWSSSAMIWDQVKDLKTFDINAYKAMTQARGYSPTAHYSAARTLVDEGKLRKIDATHFEVLQNHKPIVAWNPDVADRTDVVVDPKTLPPDFIGSRAGERPSPTVHRDPLTELLGANDIKLTEVAQQTNWELIQAIGNRRPDGKFTIADIKEYCETNDRSYEGMRTILKRRIKDGLVHHIGVSTFALAKVTA